MHGQVRTSRELLPVPGSHAPRDWRGPYSEESDRVLSAHARRAEAPTCAWQRGCARPGGQKRAVQQQHRCPSMAGSAAAAAGSRHQWKNACLALWQAQSSAAHARRPGSWGRARQPWRWPRWWSLRQPMRRWRHWWRGPCQAGPAELPRVLPGLPRFLWGAGACLHRGRWPGRS